MTLSINEQRLWQRLMAMAAIGATPAGGCNRQALSDLDVDARQLFESWCIDAGCTITRDAIGNVFARRPGNNPAAPPVMSGSHLDTQPTGGKFDGVYGVLAGLEVVETLNDHQVATTHPIDIVVWTNEVSTHGTFVAKNSHTELKHGFGKQIGRLNASRTRLSCRQLLDPGSSSPPRET